MAGQREPGTPDEGAERIMAELRIEGDEVVLQLSRVEKLEGVHGNLRAPLTAVVGVDLLDDAHGAADVIGVKSGTRIPGVVEVATVVGIKGRMFAVVHRDTPRGVRLRFVGASHEEWVVGFQDPEAVAAAIESAAGLRR